MTAMLMFRIRVAAGLASPVRKLSVARLRRYRISRSEKRQKPTPFVTSARPERQRTAVASNPAFDLAGLWKSLATQPARFNTHTLNCRVAA
jgi:hypothetical protein